MPTAQGGCADPTSLCLGADVVWRCYHGQGRKSTGPVTKRQKTAEAPSTSQLQLLPDTLWDDNMEADSAQIQRLCAEKVSLTCNNDLNAW